MMKKFALWAVGLLLAVAVGLAAKQITRKVFNNAAADPSRLVAVVKEGAEEMNKDGPRFVADGLRWDKTMAEGTLIVMNFTYVNLPTASIDVAGIQARGNTDLVKGVCGSPDLSPMLRKGVSFMYRYHGNDGKVAYEKTVTPTSCGF